MDVLQKESETFTYDEMFIGQHPFQTIVDEYISYLRIVASIGSEFFSAYLEWLLENGYGIPDLSRDSVWFVVYRVHVSGFKSGGEKEPPYFTEFIKHYFGAEELEGDEINIEVYPPAPRGFSNVLIYAIWDIKYRLFGKLLDGYNALQDFGVRKIFPQLSFEDADLVQRAINFKEPMPYRIHKDVSIKKYVVDQRKALGLFNKRSTLGIKHLWKNLDFFLRVVKIQPQIAQHLKIDCVVLYYLIKVVVERWGPEPFYGPNPEGAESIGSLRDFYPFPFMRLIFGSDNVENSSVLLTTTGDRCFVHCLNT